MTACRVLGFLLGVTLTFGLFGAPTQSEVQAGEYGAVDPGVPGDGVADLFLDTSAGGLTLIPDGVVLNGYVIKSRDGIFTGAPAENLGAFQIDNDNEISGNFFFTLATEHFFGNVVGSEWDIQAKGGAVNPFEDFTFTYTRDDQPGAFFGGLIIPEPGMVVMLLSGAGVGLLMLWRRRRS